MGDYNCTACERRRVVLRPRGRGASDVGQSAQMEVVSFEAIRALTARAFDFRPLKARLDDADHLVRDLDKVENVREPPSNLSAQRWRPVVASMSWPVIRTRLPAFRTLPSST